MPEQIDYDRHVRDAAVLRRKAMAEVGHGLVRAFAAVFRRRPDAAQPVVG